MRILFSYSVVGTVFAAANQHEVGHDADALDCMHGRRLTLSITGSTYSVQFSLRTAVDKPMPIRCRRTRLFLTFSDSAANNFILCTLLRVVGQSSRFMLDNRLYVARVRCRDAF